MNEEQAYEVASADVVLPLTFDEAGTIADMFEDVAGSDFLGANADYQEVARIAAFVRAHIREAREGSC